MIWRNHPVSWTFFLGGEGGRKTRGNKNPNYPNENDPNLQPNIKKGLFLTCNSYINNLGMFFSTFPAG